MNVAELISIPQQEGADWNVANPGRDAADVD
jgi:hypothetical protein